MDIKILLEFIEQELAYFSGPPLLLGGCCERKKLLLECEEMDRLLRSYPPSGRLDCCLLVQILCRVGIRGEGDPIGVYFQFQFNGGRNKVDFYVPKCVSPFNNLQFTVYWVSFWWLFDGDPFPSAVKDLQLLTLLDVQSHALG